MNDHGRRRSGARSPCRRPAQAQAPTSARWSRASSARTRPSPRPRPAGASRRRPRSARHGPGPARRCPAELLLRHVTAAARRTCSAASTCLHGPRSPRWRANHGHVQRAPSVPKRTRYSASPLAHARVRPRRVGRALVDQLARAEQPRMHRPRAARPVVRQLAVEVARPRRGRSRRGPPRRARPAPAARRPSGQTEPLGESRRVDRRLAVEVVGDRLDGVVVGARQVGEDAALAGEAAVRARG